MTKIEFPPCVDLGGGWTLVESAYCYTGHDAIYICVDNERALIFDTGIATSTLLVLAALERLKVPPANVDYVFISHAHLDHCAGAGHLLCELRNARLTCHARCKPHLVAPVRLIAGARSLYGARFDELYGQILPVPIERIDTIGEGDTLTLGQRTLAVLHTPGHTFDSLSIVDRVADCALVADSFGVRLAPQFGARPLSRIPSAPTQFAPHQWRNSIQRLASLGVARILITHYGEITDITTAATQLCDELLAFVSFARTASGATDVQAALRELVLTRWIELFGTLPEHKLIEIELLLSASGLTMWQHKHLNAYDKNATS